MATAKEKRDLHARKPRERRSHGKGSFLLSRISKLSARCVWSFQNGLASKWFCSADRADQAFRTGLGARLLRAIGFRDTVSGPIRKQIAAGAYQSRIYAFAGRLRRAFLHTRARFFGIAGIVFALYTAGIFLTKRYVMPGIGTANPTDLCTAAVTLLLSLLLLPCGKPLNVFCSGSYSFRKLLIDALGICPEDLRQGKERVSAHGGVAFVAGTFAGLSTVWFPPHQVLLFVLAVLFCLCIPASPETGLLTAVFLLPFVPLRVTGFLTAFSLVGYLQKYFRLKRVFRARLPECFLLLTVAASGLSAFSGGDAFTLSRLLLFSCLWLLTTSLVTTEKLSRAYHAALVYGGIPTLLFSAVRLFLPVLARWIPRALPAELPGVFAHIGLSDGVLGCYLMMLFPLVLSRGRHRSGAIALCLIALNAVLLQSMWTLLGLLLGLLLYAAFAHGAPVGACIAGCAGFPAAVLLMGDRLESISSGFSSSAHFLARKYFLTGVGAGDGAFTVAALANGLFPDGWSAGLYTHLVLEGGIVTLFLFAACAFCSLQRLFTCMREETDRKRLVRFGGIAASAVLFLLASAVTDVWADLRVLGLFWCVCPAASLTGDLYGWKREKEAREGQWI